MTTESLIGITSGIIGILTAVVGFVTLLYRRYKGQSLIGLMNQLVDNKLSTKEHKKILKKMNSRLVGCNIKEDYIKDFVLNDRKKEALFMDICDKNNIEPTKEICQKFLGADSRKAREYFNSKRNSNFVSTETTPPTEDTPSLNASLNNEGQIVYMSELLMTKYPEICKRLISILEKHKTNYAFIKGTKDIWCRDYMPVQIESGKYIQFKYEPSYLRGNKEWEESRSDVKEVCRLNNINTQDSDINLDGGNVLICDGRAIISDRIFSENPDRDKEQLVNELSKLLECEIIIIPAQKSDMTGHADGMVRFVNRNTILGNKLAAEFKYWQEGMKKVIEKYGLKYIDVPFFEPKDPQHPESAVGVYVNYLAVNNLIVLPIFGKDEDKQAIEIIQQAFPDKVIETIDYNDVAKEGGLLNCTTWVINADA